MQKHGEKQGQQAQVAAEGEQQAETGEVQRKPDAWTDYVRSLGPGGGKDAPASLQMKRPEGWDPADRSTWHPDHFSGFSYQLVNDAIGELDHLGADRAVAEEWGQLAIDKGLLGTGPVHSTYKSSYDHMPGAFSVSQDVPLLDPFVVHAHISPEDVVAAEGGVNLKWKGDEGGTKAGNVPADQANAVIDVETARQDWETHHDTEQEDLDWLYATFDLFSGAEREAEQAEKERQAAQLQDEKALISWGWKHTNDKKHYGEVLKKAQAKQKLGKVKMYDALLDEIRQAQARQAGAPPD